MQRRVNGLKSQGRPREVVKARAAVSLRRIETMLSGRVSARCTIVYKVRNAVPNEYTLVTVIAVRPVRLRARRNKRSDASDVRIYRVNPWT